MSFSKDLSHQVPEQLMPVSYMSNSVGNLDEPKILARVLNRLIRMQTGMNDIISVSSLTFVLISYLTIILNTCKHQ